MRTRHPVPLACLLVVGLFVADLVGQPGGAQVTRGVDDLAQLAAATTGAAAGLWRAGKSTGRLRLSWGLIGLGTGSWALGETIWSYYELIAGVSTPFPSLADVGFLLFPVLAGAGVLARPSRAFAGRGSLRVVLDVLLVLMSLFTISWATALGQVYHGGADSTLGMAVALSYPVLDVALLTVVVIVLAHASSGSRMTLSALGAGLIAFAVADSGFAYLTALGRYHTGNLIDAGWVGGFLLLTCAAVIDSPSNRPREREAGAPRTALLLPYLPAGIGIAVGLWRLHDSAGNLVEGAAAIITVWLLIARQVLVLLDNRMLMVRVTHQALHDDLTGLGNRALYTDRLQHALDLHRRDLRGVSLLLVDLDDFKTVNDSLGHPAGDELLVRVSERLLACARAGDTVARLGGDEFAILIEDDGDPLPIAERIMASLQQPIVVGQRRIPVGMSIGLAVLRPEDPTATCTELLRRADLAMYAAKREGKNRLKVFTHDLIEHDYDEIDLRSALALDLAAGRIDIALQPIKRADGHPYGVEALARWSYAGSAVPPSVFLPIAARLGYAPQLDEIVLAKAIAADRGPGLVLAVNLSGQTLTSPGLCRRLKHVLAAAAFPAHRLTVEVLESSLIEHDQLAVQTLLDLRGLGVQIAVDDFGTGYASIARLHALQPDIVKIDRSLVWAHDASAHQSTLLDGITQLAHQFGAIVIAEGIETTSQHEAATAAGCDAMQGYLLGRPMTTRTEPVLRSDIAEAHL